MINIDLLLNEVNNTDTVRISQIQSIVSALDSIVTDSSVLSGLYVQTGASSIIKGSIYPSVSQLYDLGSPSQSWNNVYANNVWANNIHGTFTAGLPTGSIGFGDADGNLVGDNANLYWDESNKRLRLGAGSAPSNTLEVNGNALITGVINSTWNGNSIGANYGGTGLNSYSKGDILYAGDIIPTNTTALSKLSVGASGQTLVIDPVSGLPSYSYTIGLLGQTTVIAGNLQILGTNTTVNSATLSVEDQNISVNMYGTNLTSNGAGLTVLAGQTITTSTNPITITGTSGTKNITASAPIFNTSNTYNSSYPLQVGMVLTSGAVVYTIFSITDTTHAVTVANLSGNISGYSTYNQSSSFIWNSANQLWQAGILGSEINLVDISTGQTLTNKSISGSANTLTNIANASLVYSSINASVSANGFQIGTVSLGGTFTLTTPQDLRTSANVTFNEVNALTLTSQTNGFTIAGGTTPYTLTVSGNLSSATSLNLTGTVNQITISGSTTLSSGGSVGTISIASTYPGQTSITTLGTIATGTWNASIIGLAYGGTNSNLTASAGSVVYSNTTGLALSAVGTSGQALISGGAGSPTWYTPTANQIIFAGTGGILSNSASLTWDATNLNITGGLSFAGAQTITTTSSGVLSIAPSGNLSLYSTGTTPIVSIGTSTYVTTLQSYNYASQATGWGITNSGNADFRYIYVDEMHAKAFIADLEQALAGGQIIGKSVAKIAANFTIPAVGVGARLIVEAFSGFPSVAVFQNGDMIRLRQFSRVSGSLTIADAYGTVVLDTTYGSTGFNTSNNPPDQAYTFTTLVNNGITGTLNSGQLALDYGVSGNGYYEVNSIDGASGVNSPYAQIVTWSGTTPSGNLTVRSRTGNLKGITSVTEFGFYAGTGAVSTTDKFVRLTDQNAEIRNVPLNLYASGVNTISINPATPSIAVGATLPTDVNVGDGLWTGLSGGVYQFRVGIHSGQRILFDGTNFNIYNNSNTLVFQSTSTGALIANWNISGTTLSSSGIILTGGATPSIQIGTITGVTDTAHTGSYFDASGNFSSYGSSTNFITRNGTSLNIASSTFSLTSTNFSLVSGTNAGLNVNGMKFGLGADGGTNNGIYIDANNYWYQNKNFNLGGTTGIIFDGTTVTIGSNVIVNGNISGASGTFKGSLSVGTSPNWFNVDATGNIWSGNATLAGAEASTFAVTNAGVLYATGAIISGNITAGSGSIGGFTIGTNLTYGAKAAYNDANTGIFIGVTGIGLGINTSGFYVSAAGVLNATSATLTSATINGSASVTGTLSIGTGGSITSGSFYTFNNAGGTIANWTINSTYISSTGITLTGGLTPSVAVGTVTKTTGSGIFIDTTGLYALGTNIQNTIIDTTTGKLWAKSGGFGGTLSASGINITSSGLQVNDASSIGRVFINYAQSGVTLDAYGFRTISSANNNISSQFIVNGAGTSLTGWGTTGTVTIGTSSPLVTYMPTDENYGTAPGSYFNLATSSSISQSGNSADPGYTSNLSGILTNTTYTFSIWGASTLYSTPIYFKLEQYNGTSWITRITKVLASGSNNNWLRSQVSYYTDSTIDAYSTGNFRITISTDSYYPANVYSISFRYFAYFSELNASGLFVFNSPTNYVKIGKGISTIQSDNFSISNLSVTQNADFYGAVVFHGGTTTLGSYTTANNALILDYVTSPTDSLANGGGILLYGTTNKSILWDSANANWTSNQSWNLSSTSLYYKINNVNVLSSTTLGSTVVNSSLTSVGTITSGVWNGTAIADTYISSASTWNAKQAALTFSTGLTNTANTITNNLSVGVSGGQTAIGGTGITDALYLKGTTGNGTLTSPAIQFLVGNNGGTTALTILNNGNVGIGTTSPGALLDINGVSGGSGFRFYPKTTSSPGVGNRHLDLVQEANWGTAFTFYVRDNSGTPTGDGQFVFLPNGGNVGIGTTSPSYTLDVNGSFRTYQSQNTATLSAELNTVTWTPSGAVTVTGTGTSATIAFTGVGSISSTMSLVNGAVYVITWTLSSGNYGSFTVTMGSVTSPTSMWWGNNSFTITNTTATGNVTVTFTSSNSTFNITNLSIKQITAIMPAQFVQRDVNGNSLEIRSNTNLNNIGIGVSALQNNTTGYQNSAMGLNALYSNTTGSYNSAMGVYALQNNTTGSYNSAMGVYALYYNTTGYQNSAMGVSALQNNTTGNNNSAMGVNALFDSIDGNLNIAQGYNTGRGIIHGSNNTIFGAQVNVGDVSNNVILATGDGTVRYRFDGANTTISGGNVTLPSITPTNLSTGYLPYKSSTTLVNSPVYTDGTNVGIGTTSLATKLTINSPAVCNSHDIATASSIKTQIGVFDPCNGRFLGAQWIVKTDLHTA